MFVDSATHSPTSFPSAPKPLPPVSTFVESSSCTSFGFFLGQHGTMGDCGPTVQPPLMPLQAYNNPLQRTLRLALRSQQGGNGFSPHLLRPYHPSPVNQRSTNTDILWDHSTSPCGAEANGGAQSRFGLLGFFNSNSRTRSTAPFKPAKSNRSTSSWQLRQFAEATLGSGSLRKAVRLPEGEDLNEWLAVYGECECFKSEPR